MVCHQSQGAPGSVLGNRLGGVFLGLFFPDGLFPRVCGACHILIMSCKAFALYTLFCYSPAYSRGEQRSVVL
jgi:hypothetical protein